MLLSCAAVYLRTDPGHYRVSGEDQHTVDWEGLCVDKDLRKKERVLVLSFTLETRMNTGVNL